MTSRQDMDILSVLAGGDRRSIGRVGAVVPFVLAHPEQLPVLLDGMEGEDEVRGLYESSTRLYDDGTPRTRHTTTNVAITVDDVAGTATARSYYTVFQQTEALPLQPIISGHYHDDFHRVDGEWWFDTRRMFVDLTGDLSHHLLFELR